MALQADLLHALATELTSSYFMEHWARLLLMLASCEGNDRPLEVAAAHLHDFCLASHKFQDKLDSATAHTLLAASPCLSYLLTSQLVALCAALDGGTVYGMPEAPGGGTVTTAVLALPRRVTRMEQAVASCSNTVGLMSREHGRQLGQASEGAAASAHAAGAPTVPLAAEGSASVSTARAPAAASASATAGFRGAEAEVEAEGQAEQAGTEVPGPEGAADPAADTEAVGAGPRSNALPLLLDPTVCLELSLRLTTALCGAVAGDADADSAQASQGSSSAGAGAGRPLNAAVRRRLAEPFMLIPVLDLASSALLLAQKLLRSAPSAVARLLRHCGLTRGGSTGEDACAPRSAPSPLERWWEGAVAVGGALAAVARHPVVREEKRCFGILLELYFTTLEPISRGVALEPGPQPSESVAAALSAGFLPCLERLLRAVMLLELNCEWTQQWSTAWDTAWAQMLAFADPRQVAAVVDAAAEGLRSALTAAGTAGGLSPLVRAAMVATRLDGGMAPLLAQSLADRQGLEEDSETNSSEGGSAAARAVLDRLDQSVEHTANELLPELSRALLGFLMPAFHRDAVDRDSMCFLLMRQLSWVPVLASGLAGAVLAAAADDDGGLGGDRASAVLKWRRQLLVELRLPGLLGAALGLLLGGSDVAESEVYVLDLRDTVRDVLEEMAALVPAELARMVAAADRAEAAAAGRAAAGGRSPAAGTWTPPPPSSGLLRRALGPGGPLEDAKLLAAVKAACAGGAGGAGV